MVPLEQLNYNGREVEVFRRAAHAYFNPRDVGEILGIQPSSIRYHLAKMNDAKKIILRNVDIPEDSFRKINPRGEIFLTESGVYDLVLKSRKSEAIAFKDWVTDEVLPSIRREGAYLTPQKIEEILDDPDTLIRIATKLKEERAQRQLAEAEVLRLEHIREEDAPKVAFAEAFLDLKDTILVRQLAAIITQAGHSIGQNTLYKWLRDNGYCHKQGTAYNQPTQRALDLGVLIVQQRVLSGDADEPSKVVMTTRVTMKGQQYFLSKFVDNKSKTAR